METKTDKLIVDNKVVEEMIATEQSYNQALTLLAAALNIKEIVKDNPFLHELKITINILKNISDDLLKHAAKAVDPLVTEREHKAYRAQRLQLMQAFFLAYQNYSSLFERYIDESRKDPAAFMSLEDFLATHSTSKLDLASYLIQPIQRGPRYSLLVKETKRMSQHLTQNNVEEFLKLEAFISESLSKVNKYLTDTSKTKAPQDDGYYPGKLTITAASGVYNYLFASSSASEPEHNEEPIQDENVQKEPKRTGYRFGDGGRYLYSLFTSTKPTQSAEGQSSTKESIANDAQEAEEFVLIEKIASDDGEHGDETEDESTPRQARTF
ncbi:RhoGEF domain-containing protein [Legionella fallonii]|uniref:DH domain-containing protein n=1 Tax=Legionella fallonii LLAP-10 TaxID=1212491 RepID=A0A098G578_9GAMM|nr:RhoGEF domain-containing protein [Legionella fallonii]CEG57632.1 conserved protein of unknown function [Legionella fallonii LLAP-10]